MRTRNFRRMNLRLLIALAVIAILATAAYGFAAKNSVDASHAGDGAAAVSGYNVTNVTYTLNDDPTILDAVSFDLDSGATNVKASLDNANSWHNCTVADGTTDWTCSFAGTNTTVKSLQQLRVVAAQ